MKAGGQARRLRPQPTVGVAAPQVVEHAPTGHGGGGCRHGGDEDVKDEVGEETEGYFFHQSYFELNLEKMIKAATTTAPVTSVLVVDVTASAAEDAADVACCHMD